MTSQTVMTKAELLDAMQRGWDDFSIYLGGLSEAQLIEPTDAAGWTAKDHVMHLAVWEDGMNAFLQRQPRPEHMGIDAETWRSGDFDRINAIIQRRYQDLSWHEVQRRLRAAHQQLVGHIEALTDADLQRPYNYYQPASPATDPAINRLAGNTFQHYAEHTPWIDAIVYGAGHEIPSQKQQVLAAVGKGWDDFHAYLASLTDEQLTVPTDPAGWTAKDHAAHLAIWEDSTNALFDGAPRWQPLGIDRALWETWDWDRINAVIQQRYHDISRADLLSMWHGIHTRLIGKIEALSDADLQRPYNYYQPESSLNLRVVHWIIIETYEHYDEHLDYIALIVARGS